MMTKVYDFRIVSDAQMRLKQGYWFIFSARRFSQSFRSPITSPMIKGRNEALRHWLTVHAVLFFYTLCKVFFLSYFRLWSLSFQSRFCPRFRLRQRQRKRLRPWNSGLLLELRLGYVFEMDLRLLWLGLQRPHWPPRPQRFLKKKSYCACNKLSMSSHKRLRNL